MRTRTKYYYGGMMKSSRKLLIATSKQLIATHLGICVRTMTRHLYNVPLYENDEYIIWKNVVVKYIRRGFALTHSTNRYY